MRLGHAAGAALRQAPRSERAVDLAHVVMEQHVGGAGRSDAEKRADDARGRHRRLQDVGLEPLVEQVGGAHREQLHLVVPASSRAGRWKRLARLPSVRTSSRRRENGSGGVIARIGLANRPISSMALPVFVVASASSARVARDFAEGVRVVVHAPQRVAVRHRREGAVERQDLEAVGRQVQLADDFGTKQRDDVGADGEVEAGDDLLGHGRAADEVAAFEDEHTAAGLGEVGRGRQAVVARADHDGIVGRRQQAFYVRRSSPADDAGPQYVRLPFTPSVVYMVNDGAEPQEPAKSSVWPPMSRD